MSTNPACHMKGCSNRLLQSGGTYIYTARLVVLVRTTLNGSSGICHLRVLEALEASSSSSSSS